MSKLTYSDIHRWTRPTESSVIKHLNDDQLRAMLDDLLLKQSKIQESGRTAWGLPATPADYEDIQQLIQAVQRRLASE